jgi:NAD(P)-dependent dehydrogenase (short-subunit alcohol dehydrogenase family)
MAQGSIVITGASSGIGEACAVHFDQKGFRVFAGVRKASDGEALREKTSDRLTPLVMDVTDPESIADAVGRIDRKEISGLVNNAGIAVSGPIELIPIPRLREQLEVNVIGQVAVTQAFMPLLRNGRGRIVNIGSIAGRCALPFTGPYSASKYALEAITDALRMELREWGMSVSIIEPGAVRTPIWDKSLKRADDMLGEISPEGLDLYRYMLGKMRKAAEHQAHAGCPVEDVVKAVDHAMTSPKPKTRYVIGREAHMRVLLTHVPDRRRDKIILKRIDSITT